MKKLREIIQEAEEKKVAIGHFNISNIEGLWAVFRAAQKYDVPVIIGLSEGECSFVGARQAVALVRSLREQYNYPIYLNADHTFSFKKVKEVVDIEFDSVVYDGAKLSYEENIATTKKCVEYAKSVSPNILIEAEMGYIGSSSKILDEIPEGAGISSEMFTTPVEAKKFVEKTGVDLFAPSVGNIHGMLKNIANPSLDIARIKEIRVATGVPLVLHGGSGISDKNFREAIQAGISVVHINTEIRVAYHDAIVKSLKENPDEIAPYRIMKPVVEAMQNVIEQRIKLFSGFSF
ncbi:class II fructose-bisphosphate aldolase [Patescibacteria group bacterium]|nr:class II fructose-bisphosphate aldolase [Patescibacteria group bacterium]MBU1246556.1 class II fructose-bisphosphate aldolase [Patescibacteria group bacterium]MBU1519726.1 class II fructose-bisphosphate aldolase [Patescibacteria group bacterium]MBU1730426.1 class II fructose-bisphosphate aldolase [Patescibacteria group bacterium]MBU1956493.1 class II fructose-bisphosphate aldolase [Patescibacteria group bacterium]